MLPTKGVVVAVAAAALCVSAATVIVIKTLRRHAARKDKQHRRLEASKQRRLRDAPATPPLPFAAAASRLDGPVVRIAHCAEAPAGTAHLQRPGRLVHALVSAPRDDRGPLQAGWAVLDLPIPTDTDSAADSASPPPTPPPPREGPKRGRGALEWVDWVQLFPTHDDNCNTSGRVDEPLHHADELYHCYLVYFSIKPEHAAEFQRILLQECETVLREEPGMLRYDLLRRADKPSEFLVYEVCASDAAMDVHEGRRKNEEPNMRATLAPLEATSRKLLPYTGRYIVRVPEQVSAIAWSQTWRQRVVQ